jgi:hypothetical protein
MHIYIHIIMHGIRILIIIGNYLASQRQSVCYSVHRMCMTSLYNNTSSLRVYNMYIEIIVLVYTLCFENQYSEPT